MRYAFVYTISPGYMFGLCANLNAAKLYGTQADFFLVHHPDFTEEYKKAVSKAFPFGVFWIPMENYRDTFKDNYHAYFAAKYEYAARLSDSYDAICISDGDLFLCANVNEYFECAAKENKLISADHKHSDMPKEIFYQQELEKIIDRSNVHFADFPVFVNPTKRKDFLKDWLEFTFHPTGKDERHHPLIAFNRSVYVHFKPEETVTLDGSYWVCDRGPIWQKDIMLEKNSLRYFPGERINAIHNRWWQIGRINNEWHTHSWVEESNPDHQDIVNNLDRGFKNMHLIVNFMHWLNKQTPEAYWPLEKDFELLGWRKFKRKK